MERYCRELTISESPPTYFLGGQLLPSGVDGKENRLFWTAQGFHRTLDGNPRDTDNIVRDPPHVPRVDPDLRPQHHIPLPADPGEMPKSTGQPPSRRVTIDLYDQILVYMPDIAGG